MKAEVMHGASDGPNVIGVASTDEDDGKPVKVV